MKENNKKPITLKEIIMDLELPEDGLAVVVSVSGDSIEAGGGIVFITTLYSLEKHEAVAQVAKSAVGVEAAQVTQTIMRQAFTEYLKELVRLGKEGVEGQTPKGPTIVH